MVKITVRYTLTYCVPILKVNCLVGTALPCETSNYAFSDQLLCENQSPDTIVVIFNLASLK